MEFWIGFATGIIATLVVIAAALGDHRLQHLRRDHTAMTNADAIKRAHYATGRIDATLEQSRQVQRRAETRRRAALHRRAPR